MSEEGAGRLYLTGALDICEEGLLPVEDGKEGKICEKPRDCSALDGDAVATVDGFV